jgi:Fe-S-cluster-containing hydrogenase component 2
MQIKVNPEHCTGCRLCEVKCSFAHERRFGTHISCIRVNKTEHIGIDYRIMC